MKITAEKPFSQACENNKRPILEVLRPLLADSRSLLEIGSGSGQHAVYFAEKIPQLSWQPSDCPHYITGIEQWRADAGLKNLLPCLQLDVNDDWPAMQVDALFSANSLHIMSWAEVERLFCKVPALLTAAGYCIIYGPFNYGGEFSSDSNARFQQWLQQRNPASGIRDFEAVNALAQRSGLRLLADHNMPANNRCLVWQRCGDANSAGGSDA